MPEPDDHAEEEEEVRVVPEVNAESGELNFGDQNGLIQGAVFRSSVISGRGHLSINGDVLGDERGTCQIEVDETLVVEKAVQHARIRARHIVVQGDVANSELHSDMGVEVRGDLRETVVSLGYRSGEITDLKRQRAAMQTIDKELSALEVKVGAGARKFIRDYPQVDLRLGSILIPGPGELKVDLNAFYNALGDRQDAARALQEFYLKVVVGMITRTNKGYVSQNPSRHRIFLKVIEELREHVMIVQRADQLRKDVEGLQLERNELLEGLEQAVPVRCRVRGEIHTGCRVRALQLSHVKDSSSGVIEMDETWAETKVQQSDIGPQLESWSLDGKKTLFNLSENPKNGAFESVEGSVAWKTLA